MAEYPTPPSPPTATPPVSLPNTAYSEEIPTESVHCLDWSLVLQVQNGNTAAFDVLVRKYQHRVLATVSRYIHDWSQCQDVAQDVFVRAFRAIKSFRGDSQFYTWLHPITINTAKNYLQANKRRPPNDDITIEDAILNDIDTALCDNNTPERELMRQELETALLDAVHALPEELRTAITLREIEGQSYEAIAIAMNSPVGTVRSRIFRAREAIDNKLRPFLESTLNKR